MTMNQYTIANGRVYPISRRISEPKNQCAYCGTYWGISSHPSSTGPRFADGRPYCKEAKCLACGIVQCQVNGLGHGACGFCHVGLLSGWTGNDYKVCDYAGCTEPAVAAIKGKKNACRAHVSRDKMAEESIKNARRLNLELCEQEHQLSLATT